MLAIDYMSLFLAEDILTEEEIESWKSFGDSLSSKEDRELFKDIRSSTLKNGQPQLKQLHTISLHYERYHDLD